MVRFIVWTVKDTSIHNSLAQSHGAEEVVNDGGGNVSVSLALAAQPGEVYHELVPHLLQLQTLYSIIYKIYLACISSNISIYVSTSYQSFTPIFLNNQYHAIHF